MLKLQLNVKKLYFHKSYETLRVKSGKKNLETKRLTRFKYLSERVKENGLKKDAIKEWIRKI